MSDRMLNERGAQQELGAFVVAAAFDRTGTAAFALGDGTVRLARPGGEDWRTVAVHDGAALGLAAGAAGFVTGGDDGRFCKVALNGDVEQIHGYGSRWVEHVAVAPRLLACAVGKNVHLFDDSNTLVKTLAHPSSVTGLAFDAKGKRICASHYNGASLWFATAKTDSPRVLEWKGSHTGIAIHPEGDAVVTSMQENALHGWRLADGQHMRMSGYPGKTTSMSFTRNGRWLATSGADSVVLWPFFGGGPMGKAPTELAGGDSVICTQVACNPRNDVCAAGFADGLVIVADIGTSRVLPVTAPGRGAIRALAWSDDGAFLAVGAETGFAAIVDFTARA